MRRHWNFVTDDERLDIKVGDQNSSEEDGGPELKYSRAEHVGDYFSHCDKVRDAARRGGVEKSKQACTSARCRVEDVEILASMEHFVDEICETGGK